MKGAGGAVGLRRARRLEMEAKYCERGGLGDKVAGLTQRLGGGWPIDYDSATLKGSGRWRHKTIPTHSALATKGGRKAEDGPGALEPECYKILVEAGKGGKTLPKELQKERFSILP